MGFYADLHVHSKYSRATSRDLDLEHMSFWARKKGVTVLGTGDFTHPEWLSEIETKLVAAEPGLFRLTPELEALVDSWLDGPAAPPTRFLLEVEISTIYKKDDATRKVHHLIYAPDLESVRRFNRALGRIGNLASDGRPILGLDSRDLLEITLESGEGCYLIPAHIWTPWFAALGSKSGFDSIEHCYGDLAGEIFAVETGLSSDPPMNRRLSMLDRYTLVSNSDAHSPPKIGREACRFETDLDYWAMRRALETREDYGGTVEFFAEEGKYHLDGHRKCGVCLTPEESRECDDRCPECGQPLTLGVMRRISELADRDESFRTDDDSPFRSFVPLEEVISEVQGVGPKSKAVQTRYAHLVSRLGPELSILEDVPLEEVEGAGSPLVAEALRRMREGDVIREPGFDGQYGTIRLFDPEELARRREGGLLFALPDQTTSKRPAAAAAAEATPAKRTDAALQEKPVIHSGDASAASTAASSEPNDELDAEQTLAVNLTSGPVIIVAGPGSGKTRTLTQRLVRLVQRGEARPESCLAITFTNRAAEEMRRRLRQTLGAAARRIVVATFHAFGRSVLEEHGARVGVKCPIRIATTAEQLEAAKKSARTLGVGAQLRGKRKLEQLLRTLSRFKRGGQHKERADDRNLQRSGAAITTDVLEALTQQYDAELRETGCVDFDDLVVLPVELFDDCPDLAAAYRERFRWISVDEYQDVDILQYRLIRQLAPSDGNICVIGDPDQAIYRFRGGDVRFFQSFKKDFPSAREVSLTTNYRSSRAIVDASMQMIAPVSLVADRSLTSVTDGFPHIEVRACASDRAEAEFVVHSIERMIGGSTFFSMDSGRVTAGEDRSSLAFCDFAVLYRTQKQADVIAKALHRSGMPFQQRSHERLAAVPAVETLLAHIAATPLERRSDLSVREYITEVATLVQQDDPTIKEYLDPLLQVAERSHQVEQFVSDVQLGVDVDLWDPRAEAVSLLTLHAAKGLEFPIVFIVGCEDGVLPIRFDGDASTENLIEEQRLFFVGMTRAEKRLLLTHAAQRRWQGKVRRLARTPFVETINPQLLVATSSRHRPKPQPQFTQLTLFDE